jgi:hypothetical protein
MSANEGRNVSTNKATFFKFKCSFDRVNVAVAFRRSSPCCECGFRRKSRVGPSCALLDLWRVLNLKKLLTNGVERTAIRYYSFRKHQNEANLVIKYLTPILSQHVVNFPVFARQITYRGAVRNVTTVIVVEITDDEISGDSLPSRTR